MSYLQRPGIKVRRPRIVCSLVLRVIPKVHELYLAFKELHLVFGDCTSSVQGYT